MRSTFPLLFLAYYAVAQTTPGTVTYSPPAPRKNIAAVLTVVTPETPPVIACTVTGNKGHATKLGVSCQVNGTSSPSFNLTLMPGQAFTWSENFGTSDAITFIAVDSTSGQINVTAAVGGITGGGNF
jgi:hypothetical protein